MHSVEVILSESDALGLTHALDQVIDHWTLDFLHGQQQEYVNYAEAVHAVRRALAERQSADTNRVVYLSRDVVDALHAAARACESRGGTLTRHSPVLRRVADAVAHAPSAPASASGHPR